MRKICVIGPGRAGGALAIALSEAGSVISALVARNAERAAPVADAIEPRPRIVDWAEISAVEADLFIIAVNDGIIAGAAADLASGEQVRGKTVLHLSGSRNASVLSTLKDAGAFTGGLHPLVSISDPFAGSKRFDGVYFCVEGDPEAVSEAREIAASLGGNPFEIPSSRKPLYHASAVVACGHLVALIDSASGALERCGLARDKALEVLLPLIQSTVKNLESQAAPEALTGTFARADLETMEAHLEAISDAGLDEFREIYLLLGQHSLRLAEEHGADPAAVAKMRDRLGSLLR